MLMPGNPVWVKLCWGLLVVVTCSGVQAEPVSVFAAGSLKAALSELARAFQHQYEIPVQATFGPSGLLRERIEAGEPVQVFASANMQHPQKLHQADLFLTYCTNAVAAKREVQTLRTVRIPTVLTVGADYGLIVLGEPAAPAWRFALYILSPAGQQILADYGFDVAAVPGP